VVEDVAENRECAVCVQAVDHRPGLSRGCGGMSFYEQLGSGRIPMTTVAPAKTPKCAANANSCEISGGCSESAGCNFSGVACDLPANPCQEAVRTPEASTCCNYQARNCAAEFNNNPNYVYSCDPTPGTGGCRAFIPQTITFNTPGPQVVGTMLNLVASASSGLPVSFMSKTTSVCTVTGTTANLLMTGTCTIEATQPGGAPRPGKTPYAAAPPVDVSFVVNSLQTPTVSLTAPSLTNNTAVYGGSFTPATATLNVTTAPANGTSCNGAYTGTFNGNITVAAGEYCEIDGGTVNGNLTSNGGTVVLINAKVTGNVQISGTSSSPGARQHVVCGSTVQSNLQFQNDTNLITIGGTTGSNCGPNTIAGNLQLQNNSAAALISVGQTSVGKICRYKTIQGL
jgi:hypothetical protein